MSEDTSTGNKNNIDRIQVFAVYNVYRLVIGSILLALTFANTSSGLLSDDIILPVTGAGVFTISSIIIALLGPPSKAITESGIFGVLMMDVVATTLIADPSPTLNSDFTPLYLVTVAAASMLLVRQQLATLVAALTALAMLADTLFSISRESADTNTLLYTGLWGLLVFLVSWLGQFASSGLLQAEQQAAVATKQVRRLKLFNDQIVEHMRTGILLVTPQDTLKPINSAAKDLLMLDSDAEKPAAQIDPHLAVALDEWRDGSAADPQPYKPVNGHRMLLPRFTTFESDAAGSALLLIDDYTPVTQIAQSLKLNSLGRLTASIAHEIRNPLSAVSSAVQLLAENEAMSDDDRNLANIVIRNTQRMNDTVSQVLELSRRVPPKLAQTDVNQWIPTVIKDFQDASSDAAVVTVSGSCAWPVLIDESQMKRVLDNLLDNALRYSESATNERTSHIHIGQSMIQRLCFVDVIDNGEGVPESAQTRLFEPFFTTRPDGTGLGLYLCKELCESNGAGISYRRTQDGRSTFRISLRLQPKDVQ